MTKEMRRYGLLLLALALLGAVACAPTGGDDEPEIAPDATTPVDVDTTIPAEATAPADPTATVDAPATTPAMEDEPATVAPEAGGEQLSPGEVPQAIFDAVLADALTRSGGSRGDVTVQKSEQVQWGDGSLGCPAPGMMYTQAIVDGYQVIFDVGGQAYDYRLAGNGSFILCENGSPVMPGG